jgi:SAM-dependent MidA family methyltransferase
MEAALYDPESGYYARAAQRSGRAGDFFTSVDVGPLFGQLLERQIAEMADILHSTSGGDRAPDSPVDVVEAGAGNGRLATDVLRAARSRDSGWYDRIRLHLVEASPAARAAQAGVLGELAERLATSSADLPPSFEGVLFANELLDALPVHQVVMREDGLREVYVDARRTLAEGPLSTPALSDYLARLGVALQPGWRAEINLRAVDWVRDAARRLRRGFLVLIDYGHEADELYSATHAGGTLTSFTRHTASGAHARRDRPTWLERPGEQDLTSHVDFTSVRLAAEDEGLSTIGFLDQTYFILGLLTQGGGMSSLDERAGSSDLRRLKTLLMPGGLGSSHKVLILGKDVGRPALSACSFRQRVT